MYLSMNVFEKIFSRLNEAMIEYAVVGGVAVNLHGFVRHTGDLDLILALNEGNIAKMDLLMKELGYLPRQPIEFKDLINHDHIKKLAEEKHMKAFTFMGQGNNYMSVDIVVDASLDFDKFKNNFHRVSLNGIIVTVIGLDDLLEMKRQAGRPEDLKDIIALTDAQDPH